MSGRRRASPAMLSEPMSKTEKKSRSARNRRWSAEVTKHSAALDLEHEGVKARDPRKIARSLKHSAEQSNRRKGTPYKSAMSMLNFYINRAGTNLSRKQKRILENARQELRDVFGRK